MSGRWAGSMVGALLSLAGLSASPVRAAEITVMSSGGLTAAIRTLAPAFQRKTGHEVHLVLGPSMGTAPEAIPNRLSRGEGADLLLMVGSALDSLVARGVVRPESRTPIAQSKIAMAVREGAPEPSIATLDEFKAALLKAKSIAYSDSASGVYIEREMYRRLGLEDQVGAKSRMIVATPVGEIVAKGESEIGFQQLSELLPVKGIAIVGLIPDAAQQVTLFSAGIPKAAAQPDAAMALIAFLRSPVGEETIRRTGLDPADASAPGAATPSRPRP